MVQVGMFSQLTQDNLLLYMSFDENLDVVLWLSGPTNWLLLALTQEATLISSQINVGTKKLSMVELGEVKIGTSVTHENVAIAVPFVAPSELKYCNVIDIKYYIQVHGYTW